MSKKQKDEENIDVVRKILDDPQQPIQDSKDVYLETLKRRLLNQTRVQYQKPISNPSSDPELTPQVTIHHTSVDQQEAPTEQPQETISQEPAVSDVDQRFFRPDEDLFEIEHVKDDEIPDFIEVKPKDQITVLQSDTTTPSQDQDVDNTQLPKWELVEEGQEPSDETVEEFQEVETEKPVFEEQEEPNDQETMIWEPADHQTMKDEKSEKKPLFKKFTRQKPTFESADKEPKFMVKDLKTSIKKLQKEPSDAPFQYKGYTLYQKEMDLGNNKKRIIHFFSKDVPDDSTPSPLPKDYEVRVNKKTGVPYIRKKEA